MSDIVYHDPYVGSVEVRDHTRDLTTDGIWYSGSYIEFTLDSNGLIFSVW